MRHEGLNRPAPRTLWAQGERLEILHLAQRPKHLAV